MKRYQKTIRCPRCNSANVLKARENKKGNIKFNVDPTRLKCWNCGEKIYLPANIGFPFGSESHREQIRFFKSHVLKKR